MSRGKKWKRIVAFMLAMVMILQSNFCVAASNPEATTQQEIQEEKEDVSTEAEKKEEKAVVAEDEQNDSVSAETEEEKEEKKEEKSEDTSVQPETTTSEDKTTELSAEETTTTKEEETTASEATTEAEEEISEEATTEEAEKKEDDLKVEEGKTDFSYEDGRVKIHATAKKEANLPQNAQLKARYIAEGSKEYEKAVSAIKNQMGKSDEEYLDFVCYDIYFEADGKEIEPEAGSVKVTMKYKTPIFKDVAEEAEEYATYHITDSNKVEDVTGTVNTNSDGAVTSVGFSTDSFSLIVNVAFKVERLVSYGDLGLGTHSTNRFTVETDDGGKQIAYCLESMRLTPSEGNEEADVDIDFNNKNLQKILYYGFGGPGDLSYDFYDSTLKQIVERYKNEGKITQQQYNNILNNKDDFLYVLTHIAASRAYIGGTEGQGYGFSDEISWAYAFGEQTWGGDTGRTSELGQEAAKALYNYLTGLSNSKPEGLKLTWNNGTESTPITKDGIDIDITNGDTFTLSGTPKGSTISLKVPKGLKCIIDNDFDHAVTGPGTATITNGQSFRFAAADALYEKDSVQTTGNSSGLMSGSKSESWKLVVLYHDGNQGQDIGAVSCVDQTKNEMQFKMNFKKGTFQIVKKDEDGNPIANVTFEVYRGNTKLGEVTTDSNGTVTKEITYLDDTDKQITLKEKSAPDQYVIDPNPIYITLGDTLRTVNVTNKTKKQPIQVQKKDEDGKALAGAEFTVYDKENKVVDTFVTNKDGIGTSKALPYGLYRVSETKVPEHFTKVEDFEVRISENSTKPQVFEKTDKAAKGTLELIKEGEVLTEVTGADGDKVFVYEKTVLSGAEFELYAAEDITVNGTVLYKKGEQVKSVTTDSDGKAEVSNLAAGNYFWKETKAPEGFVLDETEYPAVLTYDGTTTSVTGKTTTVGNSRQKVELSVEKKDKDGNPLAGAEFGLYASEDIYVEDTIVLEKDGFIGTAVSGVDGVATFTQDLPLGNYYAKELKAPVGYTVSDQVVTFEASEYQENQKTISLAEEVTDDTLSVRVNKTDINGEKELAGAEITLKAAEDILGADGKVIYKKDDVIDTWISKEGEVKDFGSVIVAGGEYILEETNAPEGYAYTTDVRFSVDKDGTVNVAKEYVAEDGTILIKDDITHVVINKVDEEGNPVAGAKLVIKDSDGKVIFNSDGTPKYSFTSREEAIDLGQIPAGNYILSEIEAPEGYEVSADVPFTVNDKNDSVNTVTMTDKREKTDNLGKIKVTKTISLGEDDLSIGADEAVFYTALFSNQERTKRVSDVKALVFKNEAATSVTFENLAEGIYYVGETDEYGNLIDSNENDYHFVPQYPDGYTAEISSGVFEVEKSINNRFDELPEGYFYNGTINITKKVLKGTDAYTTDNVYYAGVFTDPDYTELYTDPIKLEMNGESETTVSVSVALGDDPKAEVTYYVTETDEDGVPLENGTDLLFTISVSESKVTMSGENSEKDVTITNTYDGGTSKDGSDDSDNEEEEKTTEKSKSSKTGDRTPIELYMLLMAAAVTGGAFVIRRKRKTENE